MKLTRLVWIAGTLALFVSILLGCDATTAPEEGSLSKVSSKESTGTAEISGETVTVTSVINGCIIEVSFPDGREEIVRYIGIVPLETDDLLHFGHGTWANRMMVEGKRVTLVKDVSDRDEHGHLLRYVYVGDTFVNARMVAEGHAYAKDDPPDSTYAFLFSELEEQARTLGRGCWIMPSSSLQAPEGK